MPALAQLVNRRAHNEDRLPMVREANRGGTRFVDCVLHAQRLNFGAEDLPRASQTTIEAELNVVLHSCFTNSSACASVNPSAT